MIKELKGRKILLICPKFFNYHIEIIEALKKLGASVDYFDERPSNKNIVKILLRINNNFMKLKTRKYYKNIYNEIKNNAYDYMIVIKPEAITEEFIRRFKSNNKNAKVFMYLWDSIENNKAAKKNIKLADKVLSFDRSDCEKYDMIFRPVFYSEKYCFVEEKKHKYEYDLLFIGTVHSDRYKVLKRIQDKLNEAGYSYYFYMYIQSKTVYYIRKLLFREFKGTKAADFRFKPLNQEQVIDFVKKSNVVLDIQHIKQTGLTMRTIEMLGANRKIITTNNEVKNYDFYNEKNIQVVNRNLDNIDLDFFTDEFLEIPYDIKNKYSINNWILELINS